MENLDENTINKDEFLGEISPRTREFFTRASGWVKAVAIIGLVGTSLGVLGGLVMLITMPVVGFIYLAIYGGMIYISILLLKMSNNIDQTSFNMETFAENFYKYWKAIVIYIIASFILAIIGGVVMATAGLSMFGNNF